jgi:tetratricopeptide (TPR) repeat protein
MDVFVNGDKKIMDSPVVLRNSRTYVPVRYITEFFGGQVNWNNQTKTVDLQISRLSDVLTKAEIFFSEKKYSTASPLYEEILKKEPNNVLALKRLANIYGVQEKNYDSAIPLYERIHSIEPLDPGTLNSLGWAYYNVKRMDEAIRIFEKLVNADPNSPAGYYGIGSCYASYKLQDTQNAKKYFQIAIDKGIQGTSLDYAKEYLSK